MKTLDEVIKALEYCITGKSCAHGECPYSEENCVDHGMEKDALHYLKKYKDKSKERTTKVTDTWKIAGYDELNAWCPECEHRITRGCSYCPTCGVKLEWE